MKKIIAFTLIAEVFHRKKRQLANSVFILASAAGGGLGMVISGQLVSIVEATIHLLPETLQALETWRLAFLYAAAPAPIMIALVATIVIHNSRTYAEKKSRNSSAESDSEGSSNNDEHYHDRLQMWTHLTKYKKTLIPLLP